MQVASRPAAYDIGFVPSKKASTITPKFIYLLNADELDPASIPKNAFVVYQGHHGDLGASLADIVLPAAAYTEKSTTWINTEGRAQLSRIAVPPPGAAREDWKIIRSVGDFHSKGPGSFIALLCLQCSFRDPWRAAAL